MTFDWKSTLGSVAPMVATALGGPMAGTAASMALDALGITAGDDPADNIRLLESRVTNATPETLQKLKEADQTFRATMRKLEIKEETLHQRDRNDARQMRTTLKDRTSDLLAILVVLAFGFAQWFLLTHEIPPVNKDFLMRAMGTVDGALMLVLSFFFGSARHSIEGKKS